MNKRKINQIIIYFKEILGIFIIYRARYFYIKSLKGCNGDEYSCLSNMQYINDGINYCIKSSLIFLFFIFLLQFKLFSFYQFILFIIIAFELIIRDRGNDFKNHGILNLSALFLILTFGEIIIIIMLVYIHIIKNKKIKIIVILFITMSFIAIFSNVKNKYNCVNWNKGINNTIIDNDNPIYPCKIRIPKKRCLIDILGIFMDFSKFINCKNRNEKDKYLLLSKSNLKTKIGIVKRVGFPITIGKDKEIKSALYGKDLFAFVLNHLLDMNDNLSVSELEEYKKPEVILDYSKNPYGELIININYNHSLSNERLSLEKDKEKNNIIFIYMDNLSRVHFYRQYKKTVIFLKKFFKYNGFKPNIKGQNFHGFEFLKYHKLDQATLKNAIAMFTGVFFNSHEKMISIIKDFKNSGYITCNVQDICHKELMRLGPLSFYRYIEFDHEYSSPNCDPNIYNLGYGLLYGENGVLRKCLYGKENFEHNLEYAKQFWYSYNKNKRFLRIVNTYAHEYSGEKSKYTDDLLYNFFKELYTTNEMNNTTLFIVGDHGYIGLYGIYRLLNSNDWRIESSLPIFIIISYDKNETSYQKQYSEIYKNQQNFVTPFDIYKTLRSFIYKEDDIKKEGKNLFNYINPNKRTCKKYNILECNCK